MDRNGQKWIADGELTYVDSKKKKVIQKTNYEAKFFNDFDGKPTIVYTGFPGALQGEVTMDKDGGFTIEGTAKSNHLGKDARVKIVYVVTSTGYDMKATSYDEATKKWTNLRSATFTIKKP